MNPWLSKFFIWLICFATIISAPFLGSAIVEENYFGILLVVGLVLGLLYLHKLHQYTWQISLIFITFGFVYAPLGFKISSDNISLSLIAALFMVMWWKKNLGANACLRQDFFFLTTRAIIITLLVYGTTHFYWHMQNPPDPSNYSWKNSIKTYLQYYGPFWIILYSIFFPQSISLGQNPCKTICRILLLTLTVVVSLRLYVHLVPNGPFIIGVGNEGASVLLPGINLWEEPHTLRWLSIFTVLLVGSILTSTGNRFSISTKLSMLFLIILGFFGACLSGGRMSIVLCLLIGGFLLFYRRKYKVLVFCVLLTGSFLSIVNIFPQMVFNDHMPRMVKRSLSLVVLDRVATEDEARISINASSEWRKELFLLALDDWQSSDRNFWFGRDVYAYDERDIIAIEAVGGNSAALESSLRRGSTHTLLSNLLVIYGLSGCILYLLSIFMVLAMLVHFYRQLPKYHWLEPLLLSAFIYFLLGTFAITARYSDWLVVLSLVGVNSYYQRQSLPSKKSPSPLTKSLG